jgi:acyl-CoA synthetase (AMP-forming)/AMP-acid ligase II
MQRWYADAMRTGVKCLWPALLAFCRERLPGYKVPKDIRFLAVEDLPRSSTGKIQRHELEKRL